MVNIFLFLFPRLFGCRKVTLGVSETDGLFQILTKLNAIPVGESHTPCDELSNYTFRLENRTIGLIVEEWQPVKLIAPKFIIEKIQAALPASGEDHCGK